MNNSEIPPSRQQIIDGLNIKSQLKNKVFMQTLEVFNLLKEILHEMSNDVNEMLVDEDNRRVRFEYRDRGKFEAELKFADDILLFSMHTDVFQFDRDHPIWKNEHVKRDPFASYCGIISVYNFLTDSFKYNRKDDLGYLIARIFINKDKSFFTEGKRQENKKIARFGEWPIDKAAVVSIVETAIIYTLNFDLLAPPYEVVAIASVEQMNAKIDSSKMQTGKRLGLLSNPMTLRRTEVDMKKIFLILVLCFAGVVSATAQNNTVKDTLKVKDTLRVPTYEELERMYIQLAAKVDSARQRAVEDSILIAKFIAESRQAGLASMPQPKKPTFWTNTVLSQLNFSQTSLTNWAAGGNSSVSLSGYVDAKANYNKNNLIFENRFQMGYGFVKMFGDIFKKTDDRLLLDSKFGYRATDKLYVSAVFSAKTQMDKGYKYSASDTTLVSQFAAPFYSTLAFGLEYKPFDWISVNFAPLTGGVVVVTRPELRTKYGNKEDQKVRKEFGTQLKVNLAKEVVKNVKLTTDLTLFSDYLNDPQNIKVNWDLSLSMQVNKLLSANIRTNLIYDDKIKIADQDGNAAPRVQFQEVLSIGLSYTISNK